VSRFDALFDRGIAVGEGDIVNDAMNFVFRDETFTLPFLKVYPYVENSGYGFYTLPLLKLQELERERAGEK
jgi:hypothetical protein